jgi:autotransporter-associated beta strand protein
MRKIYYSISLLICLFVTNYLYPSTNNYFGTSGTLNGSVWSLVDGGSPAGTYASTMTTTGGAILYFNNTTTSITGANITAAGINVNANVSISTQSGIISTFNNGVIPITVGTGFTFDLGTQYVSSNTGSGFIKNGAGELALIGNTYDGGFTLNAGKVILRSANALGSNGPLTINGGTLVPDATYSLTGAYSGVTIGGDFTVGATSGLTYGSANFTLNTPTISLGASTRTITIGGTMNYAFGGEINGNANVGITVSSTAAGILSLNGANTYTGATTINSGASVRLGNATALGTVDGGTTVNSGANLNLYGTNYTNLEPLSINGTGVVVEGAISNSNAATATFAGPVTLAGSASIAGGSGLIVINNASAITGTGSLTLTGAMGGTISSPIAVTGNIIKPSSGTWTLSGSNTYTGFTSIMAGVLALGASEVLPNSSAIALNGGTLSTGVTTGYTETADKLFVNTNSTIALGTGSHTLTFSDSHTISWGTGITLTITGWNGTSGGRIYVGNNSSGLTAGQLALITFSGFSAGAKISASGEILPNTPTLIADNTSNNVDNNIDITFTNDPTWLAAVTAVKINGTTLTNHTDYELTAGNLQLIPSGGNVLLNSIASINGLGAGVKPITIEATGYADASLNQTISIGAAYKLAMSTQPTAPASNGAILATQPVVLIQDHYGNNKSITVDITAAVGAGTWTLGGTTTVTSVVQSSTFTNLTASSNAAVTGATITFTSPGLVSVTSATFDIPVPTAPPVLTAAGGATVDAAFDVTFTDVPAWRSAITSITVGGTTLSSSAYNTTVAGKITFTPSLSTLLQSNGSKSIVIYATNYASDAVTQAIAVGAVSASTSTATIDANLQGNTTRTITCTAKDQYSNLVSGYVFKYDATITNADGTTAESYTIDGNARTSTTNDLSVAATNGSGVATFNVTLPATIDSGDGVAIQIQLNNGSTNVGGDFGNVLVGQTITFGALSDKVNGEAPFALTGTASSGLTVTYVSSNTGVATISGSTVTIVAAGSTTITASQAGDGSYTAAASVPQTLTVTATPNTTVTNGQNLSISGLTTSATSDMTIQSGGKLTVNASKSVHNLTIESGGKLVLSSTNTLTVTGNVVFKSDLTTSFSANIGNGSLAITGTVKYLKTMNNAQWYFMSFPCDVAVNNITFTEAGTYTLGTDYFIKYYDGAQRIENLGATTNWTNVLAGQTLEANKGYIIGLANTIGGTLEMNFPLVKATVQSEVARYVTVVAYGDGVTTNLLGNAVGANHKGWNLVGNPYLSKFTGNQIGVNYVTQYDGTVYNTYANTDVATLDPFTSYFVQADATMASNSILYNTAGRQTVSSSIKNDSIDKVRLYFTTSTGVDNTNLIIDKTQSADYKIGQDMEKWITKGTSKPQCYTFINGINYAFNALPLERVDDLPLGLYTSNTGNATLSADAKQSTNLAQLILTDTYNGTKTDLLTSDYIFTANAGTTNNRFFVSARTFSTGEKVMDENGLIFSIRQGNLLITNIKSDTRVFVYDVLGHLKVSKISNGTSVEVALQNKGIFVVHLTDGIKTIVRKVVIE